MVLLSCAMDFFIRDLLMKTGMKSTFRIGAGEDVYSAVVWVVGARDGLEGRSRINSSIK